MRKNNILNWIKLSSFIFALSSLFASCSNELDEALQPANNGTLQFVVSDFPTFGEGTQTRAIGTEDPGKTAWEKDDQIIITLTSKKYGTQSAAITYDGANWGTEVSLSYLENETPSVSVIYAPCYEVTEEGTMQLRSGMQLGMTEYLSGNYEMENGIMTITFEGAIRDYSRLRIATMPEATLTVTTTDFTPAGATEVATAAYTLTADDKGNAYLYGTFAEDATVSVKQGDITLKDYTFTAEKNPNGTEHNKSYALDTRPVIDGTLGGKAEATDAEVEALVQQLKDYVDSGITTIIVTGAEPAIIFTEDNVYMPAVSEAIYRLTDSGYYDENNPYNGKIDLILQDVTEIMEWEFYTAFALNSITLPKVTTIGDQAFQGCYYLKRITFGSVVTSIVQEYGVTFVVGDKVDGCDLVLNCGQMQTEDTYKPDLENNVWFKPSWGGNVTWKSITLTHTGDCDECKANQ